MGKMTEDRIWIISILAISDFLRLCLCLFPYLGLSSTPVSALSMYSDSSPSFGGVQSFGPDDEGYIC